ncbi:hypothetical protein [Streptomyces sp. EN16]|uniref:hypothetical protein n=1 Tax=Streptomyces sp. EN16 TaxID=212773 RepID=UPI000851584C|nr:hypothetical protein [Streptomyces sp. EN16]
MTGPEHYREAERLIADSHAIIRPNDEGPCEADRSLVEAQVHATLALAAATAVGTAVSAFRDDINSADVEEWADVLGSPGGASDD